MNTTRALRAAAAGLLAMVLSSSAAVAASAGEKDDPMPVQCALTDQIVYPDDGGAPEFKPLAALACPAPESLFAVCAPAEGNWLQFKQADAFVAHAALPGADAPVVMEASTPAPGVWALGQKPLVLSLWSPADKGVSSDFGIDAKTVSALCPPLVAKDKPAPDITLELAWKARAAGDGQGDAPAPVVIARSALALETSSAAAPPQPKAPPKIAPPTASEVKDTVRNEWPNRYPDYPYLDGYITDDPVCTQPNGDTFVFSMNVTIQDPDGNQLICDLKSVKVRKMETGGLIVMDLSLDLLQSCQ